MMKIRKILCCLLVLSVLFIIPLHASAYDYGENDVILDFLPGDVNCDGNVTSADARLCMRFAAALETLTPEQTKAADLDGSGQIDSSNARRILRAGAQLETLSYTANLKAGEQLVVGPYKNSSIYSWTYKTESTKTTVTMTYEDNRQNEAVVAMFDSMFAIVPNESTSFTVTLLRECPWTEEIAYSFDLIVTVSD